MIFSTYKESDVSLLLKDISGLVQPLDTASRERNIQSGIPYSEMLPIEYEPSQEYLQAYYSALDRFSMLTAQAVASVSKKIWAAKGCRVVLVSLARAGTPIGILIKRYFRRQFNCEIFHYSISIIRGVGIDRNAMDYILQRHPADTIQFVDGWTGKGAIKDQLDKALSDYESVVSSLAVLSDPAGVSDVYGTREDFLIPSSCLNSTVSGLLSRTFFRRDIIGSKDFHGAVFYKELLANDLSYEFIEQIEQYYGQLPARSCELSTFDGQLGVEEVARIAKAFDIRDINLIKPSIGEATRVLLRRIPWKVLVHSLTDEKNLGHLYRLAKEKEVEVVEYPLHNYKACGIIRALPDV